MDMGMQQPAGPDMSGEAGMQDPSMEGMQDPNMMDGDPMSSPEMGGDPNAMGDQGQENPYDSNFDAGVEADEDEDPKKYIQQLTGKLSQKLNDYNSENGEGDPGLSKYVGKMIVKQAAKALDEKGKKDLIAAINSTSSDSDDEEVDDEIPDNDGIGTEEEPIDGQQMDQEQQPMQESKFFTKKSIKKLRESILNQINDDSDSEELRKTMKRKAKKSPFSGKNICRK